MDNSGISKLMEIKSVYNPEKISGLNAKTGKNEGDELKKACEDFEAIMIHQMLKAMRKTVPDGGILEKSNGSDVWESLYDEKISFEVSGEEKGTGLAKFLYEELSKGANLNLKS
ncbi:MAG: rod-binding protein [Desulfobacteraceae bacterium]|nr:rod-binding protein [Desulfobacteraceae bacterium]